MLRQVAVGSEEELIVDFSDRTGGITTLSGVKWELYDVTGATFVFGDGTYTNAESGTADGLSAIANVDHAGLTPGTFALYIWFTVGGNNIRKGPFYYSVVA